MPDEDKNVKTIIRHYPRLFATTCPSAYSRYSRLFSGRHVDGAQTSINTAVPYWAL